MGWAEREVGMVGVGRWGTGDCDGRWRLGSGVLSVSGYSSEVTRADRRESDSWREARAASWTFCFSMIGERAESRVWRTSEAVSWEVWSWVIWSGREARRAASSASMARARKEARGRGRVVVRL